MKQPEPFISIVIPSYNRAPFLEKNIPDLLKLNYTNYELIVVDDGSKDNTSEIFDKIKAPNLFYYKKENAERAAARNYGAERAKGTYITFLDSDDQMYPDALAMAATAIHEKQEPDFLHMAYEIGTAEHTKKKVNHLKDNDPLLLVKGNPLSCMGIFVKKQAFEKQKFYSDRALSGSEDWECWLRLAANFGLRTDNHIIGKLVEHDSRSVRNFTEHELAERKRISLNHAFSDPAVQKMYGRYRKTMEAHWDTYIALHLAMYGLKKRPMHYFLEGIKKDPGVLLTKRALVICKLLVLKTA